ncbi:hypothetical protein RHGRI_029501 [Rhododendron griersonianum]|uniref:Uncharacterized protein n=1 Tax=Rhododendron griersonianum TaxID=479676 RepID=A0AAV6IJP8_9ERIC|nr:hypothetical protein RHGRI_029501 [Rhododendron griersonianum]
MEYVIYGIGANQLTQSQMCQPRGGSSMKMRHKMQQLGMKGMKMQDVGLIMQWQLGWQCLKGS